jgi:hypothetical protein
MTLSWFGHMGQQDCSNFFTTSTASDLPSDSQWKWKFKDILPFFDVLVMKRGPKLDIKVYYNSLIQVIICTSSPTTHVT